MAEALRSQTGAGGDQALVRVTRRARVDLPQPDSPTTASVRPASRVKLAPARALTVAAPPNMPRLTS